MSIENDKKVRESVKGSLADTSLEESLHPMQVQLLHLQCGSSISPYLEYID